MNINDFNKRFLRWKNGERYWDIRGIDLPRYDSADKSTDPEIQIPYNTDNLVYDGGTLPGAEIVVENKFGITPTDLPDIYRTTNGDFVHVDRGNTKDALSFINPYNNHRVYTDAMLAENARANKRYENFEKDRALAQSMGLDPILPFLNIANGQYGETLNNAANTLAWFGGAAGNLARGYVGARNMFSDDGISKTIDLFSNGQYGRGALSAAGDILNLALMNRGVDLLSREYNKYAPKIFNLTLKFNEKYLGGKLRRTRDKNAGYDPYEVVYNNVSPLLNINISRDVVPSANNTRFDTNLIKPLNESLNRPYVNNYNISSLQPVESPKGLPFINSWRNAVNEDGSLNPHEIISKLRELRKKNPGIFTDSRQLFHKPRFKNSDFDGMNSFTHMYRVALSAQSAPVAEGSTKLKLVFAALVHDIGELEARENHGERSIKFLDQIYPDIPDDVKYAILHHMDLDMFDQNPITKALHFADVASGHPYNTAINKQAILQYPYINMPTNIGRFPDENNQWKKTLTDVINPVLKKNGYDEIDINQPYQQARLKLIDVMNQDRTFLRGVRLISSDDDIRKAIEKTRSRLKTKLGRNPTDDELRRFMIQEIPPSTGSGRRGQPEMRKFTLTGHNYGSLYLSNSNETASGYGANRENGAIYTAATPLDINDKMSLGDIFFKNYFPLFDAYTGNTSSQYNALYRPVDVSEQYKLLDLVLKKKISLNEFLKKSGIRKQTDDQYSSLRTIDLNDPTPRYYTDAVSGLRDIGVIDQKYFSAPVGLYDVDAMYSTYNDYIRSLNRLKNYTRPGTSDNINLFGGLYPLRYLYGKFGKPDILRMLHDKDIDKVVPHYVYNMPETKALMSLYRLADYLYYKYASDVGRKTWIDYINNPRISARNKLTIKNAIEGLYGGDNTPEFEDAMRLGVDVMTHLIEDWLKKLIIELLQNGIPGLTKEIQNKTKSRFIRRSIAARRKYYLSILNNNRVEWTDKALKEKNSMIIPDEFVNKNGFYPLQFTKEFYDQMIDDPIYTTEGFSDSYSDRTAAQHYIHFGKKHKKIYKPLNIKYKSKGGVRISKDRGQMDSSLSHRVNDSGKSGNTL